MPGLGSTAFNPGVVSAQQSGLTITVDAYPQGDEGVAHSCDVIAEKIRHGVQDPRVLGWGDAVLKGAKIDGRDRPSNLVKTRALLEAFREATVYRGDPPNTEFIQSPAATLCLGPNLCVSGGDCDDMVVALGSVLLAQSIPTQVVKQFYGAEHQQHVLLAVEDGGVWYYVDPSTRDPITTRSRAAQEEWFDPINYQGVTGAGATSAEIVTLGRSLEFLGIGADTIAVAPAGPYAQARIDLQNQVALVVSAGDTYAAASPPEYASAVQSYMAAGQAGATSVGPEIDLAGAPNVTAPWTQQAWQINTRQLQPRGQALLDGASSVPPTLITAADAQAIGALAKQMLSLYARAIAEGEARPNTVKGPAAASGINPAWVVLGLGLAGGLAWTVLGKRGRRRR